MIKKTLLICSALSCAADASARAVASQTECIWVDDARIVVSSAKEIKEFGYANRGHQIGRGKRAIIAIRRLEDPDLGPDSPMFMKTTIVLSSLPKTMTLGSDHNVKVLDSFFSEGNSAFVEKKAYAWAVQPLQSIRIKKDTDGLRLRFSQRIVAKDAETKQKEQVSLHVDCLLQTRRVGDLSLWQGYPGTTLQSFYPPAPDARSDSRSNDRPE